MASYQNLEELYLAYEEKLQDFIVDDDVSGMSSDIINRTNKLNKTLSNKQIKELDTISELMNNRDSVVYERIFIYAFKLAVKLILGGLSDDLESEVDKIARKYD